MTNEHRHRERRNPATCWMIYIKQYTIISRLFHSISAIIMLHCGLVPITNEHTEREREREGVKKSNDLLNDLHNQPTSWRKVYSAQQTVWERYCIMQLCHKLDERGNPYHGWIFSHDICQRSLLCETRGWIFTHKVCSEGFTNDSHGWIFIHNVHHESVIMFKSWVNFYPLRTWVNYKGWITTYSNIQRELTGIILKGLTLKICVWRLLWVCVG